MTTLLDTVSFKNMHAASRAYYAASEERLPFSSYEADRIAYYKTPVAEVRAEAERNAKARKEVEKRQACERKVIRFAVRHLLKQGCAISVYYGGEEGYGIKKSTSERAIMAAVQACDEEWLSVSKDGKRLGTIALVYGNSGPEVICDYHMSLEALLEPVMAYCDKLQMAGE